jgi:hypothetical protein
MAVKAEKKYEKSKRGEIVTGGQHVEDRDEHKDEEERRRLKR